VSDTGLDPATEPLAADPLREQLLDAAARVFAEKGYDGTKIMDIVKAAGLSSGAVYGRFDSKEDLLMEAVLRQVERNAVANRFHGKAVAEVLVEASRASGALDDVEAIELEAFVAARREPEVAKAIAVARERWHGTVVDALIGRVIADGSASPDADFGSIVYFLEAVRLGLLVQRGAGQEAPDEEAWTTFIGRVFRHMADPPRGKSSRRESRSSADAEAGRA
jgi:AcrR family transcriptional regulator